MLDNCSQRSFIKDEIIEDLGISGRKLKLSLKTLTGEKSEDTEAIDGLIISAVDSEKGRPMEWIELPKAYSKNCLPVEKEEIAAPESIYPEKTESFWIFWKQTQKRMGHIMEYLYHSGIVAFNSLITETKLLKECII